MDMVSTYFAGELEKDIYMHLPEGYDLPVSQTEAHVTVERKNVLSFFTCHAITPHSHVAQ